MLSHHFLAILAQSQKAVANCKQIQLKINTTQHLRNARKTDEHSRAPSSTHPTIVSNALHPKQTLYTHTRITSLLYLSFL